MDRSGSLLWGKAQKRRLGPLGCISHLLCRAGRWGVSGVSCNLYFAEVKHISGVGGSVFCGIGGAWPVCLGDSPTPSPDAPDSACDLSPPCRLLLHPFTQPLPEPPAPLPRLSSRLLCLREGDLSQIIPTGSLLHMLATEMLVRAKLHVPSFYDQVLLWHPGRSGSQVPILPTVAWHRSLGTDQCQLVCS